MTYIIRVSPTETWFASDASLASLIVLAMKKSKSDSVTVERCGE